LFQSASNLVANYRRLLAVPQVVPDELAKVTAVGTRHKAAASRAKSPQARKK
jgi:hypothetical protein